MVTCNICGKTFKNTQGLRGHRNFVHPDTNGNAQQPVSSPVAQSILEPTGTSHTPVITEQKLDNLDQQTDSVAHQLASLTKRLEDTEHQLEQLKTQSQNVRQHNHSKYDDLPERLTKSEWFGSEYSELLRDLKIVVKREQLKHSCVYSKWSISDVFNQWSSGGKKPQVSCQLKELSR